MSDEYEGVTLNVETKDWPEGLFGLVIKEQRVYVENGMVKVVGDPIWNLGVEDAN